MNKLIQKRWYLSIVILPLLVGLVTNTISFDAIQNKPLVATVIVLSIILTIVSVEFFIFYKKTVYTVSEHDKLIIQKLIHTLNLEHVQDSLAETNAWAGYQMIHLLGFYKFSNDSKLLTYRLANKRIQLYIDATVNELDNFLRCFNAVFPTDSEGWSTFNTEIENDEIKKKEVTDKLNILATNAYNKIEKLAKLIRQKNILISLATPPPPKPRKKRSEFWGVDTLLHK